MRSTPRQVTGANVRAEMARQKVSQVRVAERLGLSQTAISARLNGRVSFNVDELHAVADLLGLPITDLIAARVVEKTDVVA